MLEILELLILYLVIIVIVNLGIWLRLKTLCGFSEKTTKILMLCTTMIFIVGIIYLHVIK